MEKIIKGIILTFFISTSFASQTFVVGEVFTATWWPYCPSARAGLNQMMNELGNFIPLIWEQDGHYSPHYSERNNMYAVNGIPHAAFQGQEMIVGGIGGGNMYSYYMPVYNQFVFDNSPVYMDITMLTNASGGVDI